MSTSPNIQLIEIPCDPHTMLAALAVTYRRSPSPMSTAHTNAVNWTNNVRPIYDLPKPYRFLRRHGYPSFWVDSDARFVRTVYRKLRRSGDDARTARATIIQLGTGYAPITPSAGAQ